MQGHSGEMVVVGRDIGNVSQTVRLDGWGQPSLQCRYRRFWGLAGASSTFGLAQQCMV
jgi:hypothetical protein